MQQQILNRQDLLLRQHFGDRGPNPLHKLNRSFKREHSGDPKASTLNECDSKAEFQPLRSHRGFEVVRDSAGLERREESAIKESFC
jgi:hypothetical protein